MRTVHPRGRTFRITQPHGLRASYLGMHPGLYNRSKQNSHRIYGSFSESSAEPQRAIWYRRHRWIGAYFQRRPKSSSAGSFMSTPDYLFEKGGTVFSALSGRFEHEG